MREPKTWCSSPGCWNPKPGNGSGPATWTALGGPIAWAWRWSGELAFAPASCFWRKQIVWRIRSVETIVNRWAVQPQQTRERVVAALRELAEYEQRGTGYDSGGQVTSTSCWEKFLNGDLSAASQLGLTDREARSFRMLLTAMPWERCSESTAVVSRHRLRSGIDPRSVRRRPQTRPACVSVQGSASHRAMGSVHAAGKELGAMGVFQPPRTPRPRTPCRADPDRAGGLAARTGKLAGITGRLGGAVLREAPAGSADPAAFRLLSARPAV